MNKIKKYTIIAIMCLSVNAQTTEEAMEEKKSKLTDMQYYVTQACGTEPAFDNEYWDHKEPGIYVDIVSGEALFASVHKYDSNSGWPSFYQPIEKKNVTFEQDYELILLLYNLFLSKKWKKKDIKSIYIFLKHKCKKNLD